MSYNLEKVTNETKPIYSQMLEYYKYAEFTRNFTPKTMEQKTKAINYFIEFTGINELREITNDMIDKWIGYQKSRGNTGVTINGRLAQLRAMLKWQKDCDISMPRVKVSKIVDQKEEPSKKVFYERNQIERVLSFAGIREQVMIRLFFDCGLRIGEMIKLRLMDMNGRKIRIVGKGRKQRFVIMSEDTRECLDKWIEVGKITDYLWPSWTKKRHYITDETARRWLRKPFYAAGLYDFYPHALRHSYATEFKMMGMSNRQIQVGLGHSDERTTERYLHDLAGFDVEDLYQTRYDKVERKKEDMNLKAICDGDPSSALILALIKEARKRGENIDTSQIIKWLTNTSM